MQSTHLALWDLLHTTIWWLPITCELPIDNTPGSIIVYQSDRPELLTTIEYVPPYFFGGCV